MSPWQRQGTMTFELISTRPPDGPVGGVSKAALQVRAQFAALRDLEVRVASAQSLTALSDTVLETIQSQYPSAGVVSVDVDAEGLSGFRAASRCSRVSAELALCGPVTLGARDRAAVQQVHRAGAHDPAEEVLARDLGLVEPVIGRVVLDEAVIALLIVDRSAERRAAFTDHLLVRRAAELATDQVAEILDAFFADFDRAGASSSAARPQRDPPFRPAVTVTA